MRKRCMWFLVVFIIVGCSKTQQKYDLYISTTDYDLNIKTGEFKIDWYKNYKSNIKLSVTEKEKINELLDKYHLENLNGEKYVAGTEYLIMPNFDDVFILKKGNSIKCKVYISTQVNLKESKLNKTEIEIFNFKEEIFKLLHNNIDFMRNMDTVKVAQKKVPRLFL